MNHFNSSERTSSSSYITTRTAENFLLQDKLYGFSMGKSLIRCRRESLKVQQYGLKMFVFLRPQLIITYTYILRLWAIKSIATGYCKSLPSDYFDSQKLCKWRSRYPLG